MAPRAGVQALAKAYGIRANLKTTDIVSRLGALGVDVSSPPALDPSMDWIPPPPSRRPGNKNDANDGEGTAKDDGSRPVTTKRVWTERPMALTAVASDDGMELYRTVKGAPITASEAAQALALQGASDVALYSAGDFAPLGMVFATGRSRQHLLALTQALVRAVKARGLKTYNPSQPIEGVDHDGWMLVDTGSLVVNVFTAEERVRYDLEGKWLREGHAKIEST